MAQRRRFVFTLKGHLPTKANSRRIVTNRKTGKPFSIKSDDALSWTENCIIACKKLMRDQTPLLGKLGMKVHIYYRSNRSDLDVGLLQDGLQKGGVYGNDRQLVFIESRKEIDPISPRSEVEVWELEDPQETPVKRRKGVVKLKPIDNKIIPTDNYIPRGSLSTDL
jgi:Holliday junction resolvase RusA-like endonuclease